MGRMVRLLGMLSLFLGAMLLLSTIGTITGLAVSEGAAGGMTSALGAGLILAGVLLLLASMDYD